MARSKIEMAMSENDLQDFCKTLANTPNLTLKRLQSMAEKRGIKVSLMGAKTFRDGAFAEHLRKLERGREFMEQARQYQEIGLSGALADTAAATILQEICDLMASGGEYNITKVAQAVASLQAGEHRRKELVAKLKEYERKEIEWQRREAEREENKKKAVASLKKGSGLSDEAIALIESKLAQL